jgi:hypothetical protein
MINSILHYDTKFFFSFSSVNNRHSPKHSLEQFAGGANNLLSGAAFLKVDKSKSQDFGLPFFISKNLTGYPPTVL